MVAINDATIRHNVFETIYDLLSAEVATSDFPVSGVTLSAAYVDESQKIPQVVIHPIDVDYDNFSFGRTNQDKEIRVLVDIFTKKSEDLDKIADELGNLLLTNSFTGFYLAGMNDSTALETPGLGSKIRLKSLACTFMRR